MSSIRRQSYKKVLKLAIPRNGDAAVYQLLSIARNFKTPYLCTRNRKSAVMLAILEWIASADIGKSLEVKSANRHPHFSLFINIDSTPKRDRTSC